jgi:glycosyltransferase involved in cell wall biosynthesis
MLTNVFRKLQERYHVEIKIVGDINISLENVKIVPEKWSYETEITQLQSFDIGIMPMTDDEWTKGKCGLKILQYMAVGLPCVCSPAGVNKEIVQDGVNGFLANSNEEWIEQLSLLIENPNLRKKLGIVGRKTVEERYSLKVNAPRLRQVIKKTIN